MGQAVEEPGRVVEKVGAKDDSFLAVDIVRRIPDLADALVGIRHTTVDSFPLPESFPHLQADLEAPSLSQ